ncbi:hypothetical protein KY312_02740 [Candidatus Woesearchaeota archaeon]|nr:hypothetical protein [Candidatus Woesearchaeota archaeon]
MKKLIVLIIFSILLFGCAYEPPITTPNYRIGYDGINIRFSIFPESDAYENEEFIVQMEAWNRGAYDTNNVQYALNYDHNFFYTESKSLFKLGDTQELEALQEPILHGRSIAYPEGEFATTPLISFTAKEIFLTDFQKFNFIAKICYGYKTEATLQACIGKKTGYRSCNFQDLNQGLNMTKGQGAPLAVTSVEESIIEIGDKIKPRFTIIVENKGTGQVFRDPKTNVEKICSGFGIGENVLDRFDFKLQLSKDYKYDSTKTDNSFTCRPLTPKLEQGKAEIICTLNEAIDAGPAFITNFIVELSYGYSDKVTRDLTVRRS